MRLCANMFLKGLFTSDIDYQPGISASEARKLGLLDQGISPVPREMAYPLPKGADWHQLYDYIQFPPGNKVAQFGIIANAKTTLRPPKSNTVHSSSQDGGYCHEDKTAKLNQRETSKGIYQKEESKVMEMALLMIPPVSCGSLWLNNNNDDNNNNNNNNGGGGGGGGGGGSSSSSSSSSKNNNDNSLCMTSTVA